MNPTKKGSYLENGKLVKNEVFTFSDYVEILEAISDNPNVYREFWNGEYSPEMAEMGLKWDWKQALDDGMDILDIKKERDWFEYQIVCALEDGNLATFGDYEWFEFKETIEVWNSLTMKQKSEIAKKYSYTTHRTIDAWCKKEEVGRLKLLNLILKEELKMENKKAINKLIELELIEKNPTCSYMATIDNNEVHEALEDEVAHFKEILGQDTYVFGDGSYIMRLEDEYFLGDDVDMF